MKKIINTVGFLTIILTIITFNLIIGANEKTLPISVICILLGLSTIVLVLKKILYKENIVFKSKIDVAVLCFMICLFLPLFLKTYCTFQGTIEFIIKYYFVYSIYLLTRNVVDTTKKSNILIIITILSSLIFIIIGIDISHENRLEFLIDKLDLCYEKKDVFYTTFGYANTVAIYLLFCIYLAINRIENINNKIVKALYVLYIILASYIIYLTSSRLVLLILLGSLILYLFYRYHHIFSKNKKLKLSIIIGSLISIIVLIIYVILAVHISRPCPLEEFKKIKKKFNPNEKYEMVLELDVDNSEQTENINTAIQIIQVNEYFQETILASKPLEENTISFEFTPTDSVYYIKIKVINLGNRKILINKCYINNKEYVLKSKLMSNTIYSFIQALTFKDEGILKRIQYYKACMKIAKNHLLVGQGGNTWKKLYYVYQEQLVYVKETHSYFFELLISYGIIGVVAFLSIIVLTIKENISSIIKDKAMNKQKLSIFVGLLIMLLHSLLFDFNMSFIIVILAVFEYIAILQIRK